MAKTSVMTPGLCYQGRCVNNGPRCGSGYCQTCCRAFHPTHDNSRPAQGVVVVASNISTAVQPDPPSVYEVGEIRLVCSQDILPGGR